MGLRDRRDGAAPASDSLQPTSHDLQPKSDGLRPTTKEQEDCPRLESVPQLAQAQVRTGTTGISS